MVSSQLTFIVARIYPKLVQRIPPSISKDIQKVFHLILHAPGATSRNETTTINTRELRMVLYQPVKWLLLLADLSQSRWLWKLYPTTNQQLVCVPRVEPC